VPSLDEVLLEFPPEMAAHKLRLSGMSQQEIAGIMGVSRSKVSRMLKEASAWILDEQLFTGRYHIREHVEMLDALIYEAAKEWVRSTEPVVTTTTISGLTVVLRNGQLVSLPDQTITRIRSRLGKVAFMLLVLKLTEMKLSLLGIGVYGKERGKNRKR